MRNGRTTRVGPTSIGRQATTAVPSGLSRPDTVRLTMASQDASRQVAASSRRPVRSTPASISGLDIAKIKQKLAATGLASEAELEQMTDQQIHQFIFKPGFSTASQVTVTTRPPTSPGPAVPGRRSRALPAST